jgi:hypothetical protein
MANLELSEIRQAKTQLMLRQARRDPPAGKGKGITRQHNPGRNITGVAKPVSGPGAVFVPQQRQRHVRPTHLAVNSRPVRNRTLIHRYIGRRRKQQRLEPSVVQFARQRPAQAGPLRPLQVFADRPLAQPQTLANRTLRQPVAQPQTQNLAYLPHRHSLTRHLDPLLLGKGPTLPSVEDRQRKRPEAAVSSVIMITGTDDHDPPERMITIHRNQ